MYHILVTFNTGLTNSILARHLDSTSVVDGRLDYIDAIGELRRLSNVRTIELSATPSATPGTVDAQPDAGPGSEAGGKLPTTDR